MIKQLLVGAALVAVAGTAVVLGVSAADANAKRPEQQKVTICHRTNSVTNPYVQITVSKSAVDGQGNNDHTHHTGPVAISKSFAELLKKFHHKWGDIIPPFDDYAGYNWGVAGQTIYNHGCNYVGDDGGDDEDKVTICHRTNSVTNPYKQLTVSVNAVDGKGKNDHTHHTGPVATSEEVAQDLKDNKQKWGDIIPPFDDYAGYNWTAEGQAVYNNGCNYVEEEPTANVSFTWVCDVEKHEAVFTFKNTGDADGTASVNNNVVNVLAGSEGTVYTVPTAEDGTQITVVINDQVVFNQLVTCEPGKGGGGGTTPTEPTTPTKHVASLPYTAGDNTGVIAVIASVLAGLAAIAGVAVKSVLLKQL